MRWFEIMPCHRKRGNIVLYLNGDVDVENLQMLRKVIELLIANDSIVTANCQVYGQSPLCDDLQKIEGVKVTKELHHPKRFLFWPQPSFWQVNLVFQGKDFCEILELIFKGKEETTLEFECAADGIDGVIGDIDGSGISISKEKYEQHKRAINGA